MHKKPLRYNKRLRQKLRRELADLLRSGGIGSGITFRYPRSILLQCINSFRDISGSPLDTVYGIVGIDVIVNNPIGEWGIKVGNSHFAVIRQTNLILSKIDDIPDYDQAEKEKVLGQTYFFRAFHYFDLIRSYGDVPYIDKPLTLADQASITRTPREEVYTKMMADFDKAIAYLPTQWGASDYGRITKGAAYAMKARAALYYGNWKVAADNAKAVMDLGVYSLYDKENTGKYEELFWEKTDGCDEFILVRQFKASENGWYLIGWEAFPTKGWGGINPTQSLVDAFEDINGAPIEESTIYDAKNPFANRDPRLEVTVLHDGDVMYGDRLPGQIPHAIRCGCVDVNRPV